MNRSWATPLLPAAFVAMAISSTQVQAKSTMTGTDQIHAQSRQGSRVCMSSHEHFGEGSLPSRKGAEGAAIRAWQVFTSWEYGSAWGQYAMAAGKSMTCSQSGGSWTCKTSARPCRSVR